MPAKNTNNRIPETLLKPSFLEYFFIVIIPPFIY
jgi:hypothetical protein